VDEKEIAEAALQLSIFTTERELRVSEAQSEVLRELLREAKPAWAAKALDSSRQIESCRHS